MLLFLNKYKVFYETWRGHPIHGGRDYDRCIIIKPDWSSLGKLPMNKDNLISMMYNHGWDYEGEYVKWTYPCYMFSKPTTKGELTSGN